MPSATDFFPAYITEFMNFVMMMFPNFGSGSTSRFSAEWRRDICFFPRHGRARPGHPRLKLARLELARLKLVAPGPPGLALLTRDDHRYAPVTSDAWRRPSSGAACGS